MRFAFLAWAKSFTLLVNGEESSTQLVNGYVYVTRKWQEHDQVQLQFPMETEILFAHPDLRENAGKVALQRGPVVYCLEQIDNGEALSSLSIDCSQPIEASFESDLLNGIMVLKGKALRTEVADSSKQSLYLTSGELKRQETSFKAIPYYAWANRGVGEMVVWMAYK
ncbi:beta-L-arabinofuranosidase domain-containing protein [Alkalicoccobacillus plakortidis]|uniref:beta-L-arabinofuranosidase domain-containing protein n=1 Tax=Alkalicoccobacillus plakortidis TaxID=444060 RepID=UPI0025583929|nr:beta-L-arabinofuranosidase domain-containing protein [Alkalicoccobacillus plakortidis]